MICLVTGCSGFIGSHLVERLVNAGHEVHGWDLSLKNIPLEILDNDKFKFAEIDIRNEKEVFYYFDSNDFKPDYVFHLAGKADVVPSIEKPRDYYETNVTGTFNLLEAVREIKTLKKFIYAASSSCYGDEPDLPTPESSQINPKYPYAMTKYLGEQLAWHYQCVYKIPVVSLRLFNVYGPRSRTTGSYGAVLGMLLKQFIEQKPFTIHEDGSQSRDFIYVSDVVEAFIKATVAPAGIFNIGAGNPRTIKELCNIIDRDHPIEFIPSRKGEPKVTWADITNAKICLDWSPKVSLEEGIHEIIMKHLDSWKEAPLWNKDSIADAVKKWDEVME